MADASRVTAPSIDLHKVHAGVDRLLLSHGKYVPVELLIDQGRLEYADYEAWRCGARGALADAFLGSQRRILDILSAAAHWAQRLGLAPAVVPYRSWGGDAVTQLELATQPKLVELLATHYLRREGEVQRDLFMDGAESVVRDDLVAALAARDTPRARTLLASLSDDYPQQSVIGDAERLIDALAYLDADRPAAAPGLELRRLCDHLRPAVERLLGARERDFMAPFWRRLAVQLRGAKFDPARPREHPSWVWAQCLDWRGVRAAVLDTPGFDAQPTLLIRLAGAELRLRERLQALQRIGLLCWRFSAAAGAALQADLFPDPGVRQAWDGFQDLDLNPPLDAAWFPALLLLAEPGLAKVWECAPPEEDLPAGRAFRALQSLLTIPVDVGDQATLAPRRILRQSHPGLLSLYLSRLRDRRPFGSSHREE